MAELRLAAGARALTYRSTSRRRPTRGRGGCTSVQNCQSRPIAVRPPAARAIAGRSESRGWPCCRRPRRSSLRRGRSAAAAARDRPGSRLRSRPTIRARRTRSSSGTISAAALVQRRRCRAFSSQGSPGSRARTSADPSASASRGRARCRTRTPRCRWPSTR
jgi:hypothetical protein